jgi:hypothetical protein
MLESWYSGDFDFLFVGRVTENGFRRQSKQPTISMVTCQAEDGVGDLDRSFEEYGRIFTDNMLTRENTLIDRGNCESKAPTSGATLNNGPPAMVGELANTLSNATFARDDDQTQVYHGRFAYKGTKTIAAGTAATVTLADSTGAGDLHGFIAGETYTWKVKLWLPSGAMLGSEWVLALVDSAGSTTQAAANTYDQWQEVRVTRTMNAGATYAYPQIQIASAASINEIWYNDAIEIEPADQSEATDNSLFHLIAKRGWRRQIQFLSNNSFENTTISDSWLVTAGGTLNKDAADGLFGSASGELIPGAAEESAYQIVSFTGTKKLNVGETYNFSVWLKSTAAASGGNNFINLIEYDGGAVVAGNPVSYVLAGGEGYTKFETSKTITNSGTDKLWCVIKADASDTINIDGAMLIQSDRALDYFEVNALDGTAGVSLADLGPEISWPWFGIKTGNVDYYHPWRRMEINTTTWQNVKSVGAGTNARYCGYDENNTLINYSILDNDYGDRVPSGELTDSFDDLNYVKHNQLLVRLDEVSANRLYGSGIRYEKGTIERLIWLASASGNFIESTADQQLAELVAVGDYWPDPEQYAEFWAEYGVNPDDYGVTSELTAVPLTGSYRNIHNIPNSTFSIMPIIRNPNTIKMITASKRDKIVGIQDAALIHKTDDAGDGDGTLDYVDSGRIVSGLDILSRAGQAQILLQNNTAGTRTVIDAAIVGKAVYKFAGKDGYIHDAYIDREDIAKNGERLIQFGGEDVIDGTPNGQLDRIADYIWKDRGQRKHVYVSGQQGAQHDLSAAEWMKMNIGDAGETENIKGTSEIIAVRISAEANARGVTQVTYRELEEAWKYDSNAFARFMSRGVVVSNPGGTGNKVTIGSSYYHGATDARVTTTDTSVEDTINAANTFLVEAYNGGIIHLTKGTFVQDGDIELSANVTLEGEGDQTILKRTHSGNNINVTGTFGSEITGVQVRNLKLTRTDSSTNAAIYLEYTQDARVENVTIGECAIGISMIECDNLSIDNVSIFNPAVNGIKAISGLAGGRDVTINGLVIDGQNVAEAALATGLELSGDRWTVTNVIVKNMNSTKASNFLVVTSDSPGLVVENMVIENCDTNQGANTIIGLSCIGTDMTFSNIRIDDIDNTGTAANSRGVQVLADDTVFAGIVVTNCSGTGIEIFTAIDRTQIHSARSTSNGTNFTDGGTNTTAAVEAS